jgi:RNA polymerase-binding transcription factor DksA
MTPRSTLNKELQTIDLRLRAMDAPAPSVHGDDADMRTARQSQEDLVIERWRLLETKRRVVNALIRIEEHVYGDCQHCLEPIDAKRLASLPYAELCISCATTLERTVRAAGQPLDTTAADEGCA